LYARKSTDVEDKQVLSIESQLDELREYAKRENIEISAEYVEKQSAKIPGRPIFNKMLNEIEKEAEIFSLASGSSRSQFHRWRKNNISPRHRETCELEISYFLV